MYSVNKSAPKRVEKFRISPAVEGVVLGLFALLLTFITAYFIYYSSMNVLKNEIRDELLSMVCTLARCLDGDLIETFTDAKQANSPKYLQFVKLMQQIRIGTRYCSYIYITRMVDGKVYFIVDPVSIKEDGTPLYNDTASLEPSVPMYFYEGADDVIKEVHNKKIAMVASDTYTDKWGTFLSAHAPIFNSKHQYVGVISADLRINELLARCTPMEDATKRAFFVSVSLALLLGTFVWFSRRFASQLNESRINIFDNYLVAKEFADQTSTSIGKQFYRTSNILHYNANRLHYLAELDDKELIKSALLKEETQLSTYADKLLSLGELKFTTRPNKLANFSLQKVQSNIVNLFKKRGYKAEKLCFEVDDNVPKLLYGAVQSYEELLGHIAELCLNLFDDTIKCSTILVNEGSRDVTIKQLFEVSAKNLKEENKALIDSFCRNIASVNWAEQLELSESVNIPIIQELLYVLTSKLEAALKDDNFFVSLEFKLSKANEDDENAQDA